MDRQYVSGVDELGIDRLIEKLKSNVEQLDKRINQLDLIIDRSKNYYKSDSAPKYKDSYRDLRYNYNIIKKNILSYVTDFTQVKMNYQKFSTSAAESMKYVEKN